MSISKQDYVALISSATPMQLVAITYDIILEEVAQARVNIGNPIIREHISKAQKLLSELITSLDMSIDISNDLLSIYMYVNKLFISCSVKSNISTQNDEINAMLENIEKILNNLLVAWKDIEDDKEEPVMSNSQQLFAGLTYKNGKLSEYIDEDTSRSFKA